METSDRQALQHVVARLRVRFPHLEEAVVEQEVEAVYREYHGSKVRNFVPILVEREVVDRWRHAAGPAADPSYTEVQAVSD
jgi:hypothetical protein